VRRRDGYNFEDTPLIHLKAMEITVIGARQEGVQVRDYFANYFMGQYHFKIVIYIKTYIIFKQVHYYFI